MPTPRAVVLAASVMLRHVSDDPVRAVTLAWRALPAPLRGLLRFIGPYGTAAARWGAGDRRGALTALEGSPARLAAFSLAVDQPTVARSALARLSRDSAARPRLAARLAYREGRLTDAVGELDDAPGWRAGRLRKSLRAELEMLTPGTLTLPAPEPPLAASKGRVLHLVTDALPSTSAGYTVRTQQVALAQRAAGLDPHIATRIGFPVTAGVIDGRATVAVDGVPYHRLLPWVMPGRTDTLYERHLRHAARLTATLQPAVLHAASNYANALIALALRDATGLPVVYEVRGFWEDTWLSRHTTTRDLTRSDRYTRTRALETHCMVSADLVVTLGEAMREEILARGVRPDKVIIVPNGVSEEFLRPLPDGAGLRAELGLRKGEHVVGLVSSLVAHEGIGTLLEAVKILNDRAIPTRALIVGDGPERTALERQAAELGISAIFTGRVPMSAVRDYHAVLDVFVVPRTPDRVCQLVTPLKPVEAMASGLPVVVSAVGGLSEIINDQVTGLTSPPLDPAGLADRLAELLQSPERRAALGASAREWVARDRTWAHNAARYRTAYERLGAVLRPLPWGSSHEEVVAVHVMIIGLGYVGLPLAQEAVKVGLKVTGLDVKQATVDALNAGRSHVDDLSDADIAAMVAGGFHATTDATGLTGGSAPESDAPDVTIICVPTPLSESDGPDLTAVKAATESAATMLKRGALVVLESTTYPGTTDEIVRPLLEKGSGLSAGLDFHLAFSPERIDPGNEHYGIRNTPKVVGGLTPACTEAAAGFYGHVCDTVVRAKSAREAEMSKLLENTYRHVNIALVNEMAIFCHELGVDLWNVIECAATKPFGFQAFYPGPGVGGHCIPIDPNYLSYKVRAELKHPFRFVELAQEINSRMPGYVVDRAAELLNTDAKPLNGARVLLLGVTYKKDIADQRESPARPIASKLLQRGAVLSFHDPNVDSWQVDGRDIPRASSPADPADLTILLQAHTAYNLADIAAQAHLLFDTRGKITGESVFPL